MCRAGSRTFGSSQNLVRRGSLWTLVSVDKLTWGVELVEDLRPLKRITFLSSFLLVLIVQVVVS